jgi:ribonucleoside-diphosphate reductase alpha chain
MTHKKWYWLNDKSRDFLSRGYIQGEKTAEQRIREIAETAEKYLGIDGFADKFEDYMSRGWISLSTPVWANYGLKRGLPCSCNGSLVEDTMESILGKVAEVGMMTKYGAGTSAYFGGLRHRGAEIGGGGKSNGPVHFMEIFDSVSNIVSQSGVRRGSMAAYLPVDHPDILDFLKIKSEGNSVQGLSIGVCISDQWMEGLLRKEPDKLKIWGAIIRKRFESGYPYIFFSDTANKHAPQCYKDKGETIYASNLCAEIFLSTRNDASFVCNISSINAVHFDEWKDTDLIWVMMAFLDTVTTEYIAKTNGIQFMEAPNKFAREQRAVGLGILGWHSLLQSKSIAFESFEAKMLNVQLFKTINEKSLAASKDLAARYGEPEMLKGYGERMTCRLAVAPTTSSSFILGQVSQGIEPQNSNYYVKKLSHGSFTYKNPYLKESLKAHNKDDQETWKSILEHGGSVQHLDFLTQEEKGIFKTFGEISQKEIIIQASARQKHIDQGQSINLMIPPDVPAKDVSKLMIFAWENGVKSLYYQRSSNPSQMLARNLLECRSCEA